MIARRLMHGRPGGGTAGFRSAAAWLAAPVLCAALVSAGCAPTEPVAVAPTRPSVTEMPFRGSIVFDMAHSEIFGADDTGPLGQSQALQRMRDAGFEVVVNTDLIDADDLASASGLVIAGPMSPLLDQEYAAISEFVERGGTVLLTIHVPFPVKRAPAHWGLPVGEEIVMSKRPVRGPQEPSVFVADSIADSRITQGVDEVLVISGWPVTAASGDAKVIVSSGADSWLAAGGDMSPKPPADKDLSSVGIVGVSQSGKGLVVVSGDDAIFSNAALGQADNARLLDNIIELMSQMAADV